MGIGMMFVPSAYAQNAPCATASKFGAAGITGSVQAIVNPITIR